MHDANVAIFRTLARCYTLSASLIRVEVALAGMFAGRAWVWIFVSGLLLMLPVGLADAQDVSRAQYANSETRGGTAEIRSLEGRVERQDAALQGKISEISAIGKELQKAQSSLEGSKAREDELRAQKRGLERKISAQKESFREAKASYEDQARAAYQGDDLAGLAQLLDRWTGSGRVAAGAADQELARVLFAGRQDLEVYEQSEVALRQTLAQISQKESDYADAVEQREATTEELRRQERALDNSISDLRSDRARSTGRIRQLEAEERDRIMRSRAASGGGDAGLQRELGIARAGIVARPVGQIPKKGYIKLYKESAAKYGFGRDWYVLAAVGRVESNHGQNVGPSTAGAMGPMQFLPSTWETSGVDGNGDGVSNVMDPRDAIPAAAQYLKTGGAPRDWYAALFSYNHADWYVKKVFAVAEAYRRAAKDARVEPYV